MIGKPFGFDRQSAKMQMVQNVYGFCQWHSGHGGKMDIALACGTGGVLNHCRTLAGRHALYKMVGRRKS